MEKLQKALKKARQERQGRDVADAGGASRPAPKAGTRAKPVEDATIDETWGALKAFEPDPEFLVRNRILTYSAQSRSTLFDILRTKIFLMMRQNGWTRLAITSPEKGCGKTTIACNLALGFSRQHEVRSMLFDLDLRLPGIARTLGLSPPHGIRSLLAGEVQPEEQLLRVRNNLAISAANQAVDDPTQILLSDHTAHAFDLLQAQFKPDIMIFDLSPMLVTDDARAVLKNVDCALIVARAEQTRMSQLDTCEREVAEYTNVLGVTLNDCRHIEKGDDYHDDYT